MPKKPDLIAGVRRNRLEAMATREARRYARSRPRTRAALAEGAATWLDGVPMHWMKDWPMPHPMLVARATGARLTDIDGFGIDDFCLGDTGSMFGHSPAPVARAIRRQARRGLTFMLPTEDALEAGRLLTRRFGAFRWQIATTATDANRFALRVARAVTGRPKVLVFNGCYHGTVDDIFVTIRNGKTVNRPGLLGQVADLSLVATAVEFNDIYAVEAALKTGEIAAILTEPVMTNSCMVLPDPGFHRALRDLSRRHGAVLILDETHTISSGPGGYTRVHGLEPDMFVVGKCVAGGMPAAVWGMADALADRYLAVNAGRDPGHSGMGTTLSANPMQFACLRATLEEVMTEAAYARMEQGAARLAAGLAAVIAAHAAPWHVVRVGARVEFICAPGPLRNGSDAAQAHQPDLEAAIHTALLNRGCLIAPFHNMMLVSPATKKRQIDRLIAAFDEILTDLLD
ncbi:MAG: aspartate aminotransferase family protein [Rhodobacter sp.]|nr:aspartate aminotransferase family protein [Rhodobacter sp.]MCA3495030.1 aspartate aminotransferase family protein [Rhodobacter sp.]MCA3501334.1 aspartate aminotransferase family protein [Rhodobacter sp.]MCA3503366.1 aspartate aminotransferase family protein [Rhodobacter sp.]MCA3517383.1 aspartate aminotransferase family protein [Rhodobacter sp.]